MVKEFIKNKRSGFYFYLLTVIAAIVSFVSYLSAANDSYGYDKIVICLYIAAILAGIAFLIWNFGEAGSIASGILYSAVFGMLIKGRFIYFVTGIMGISQDGMKPGMLIALVCILGMIFINIIAAFLAREKAVESHIA